MEICRACLSTEKEMVVLNKQFLDNFIILTSINITLTAKNNPQYMCISCIDAAKFCIEFRTKCIKSDQILKEILLSQTNQENQLPNDNDEIHNNIKIKEEVKLEYDSTVTTKTVLGRYSDIDIKYQEDYKDLSMDNQSLSKNKSESDDENNQELSITKKNNKQKTKNNLPLFKSIKIEKRVEHCRICPENFEDNKDLSRHLENHKLAVPCALCGECFVNLPHLLAHRIEHLPVKQKQCHICSKKFLTVPCLEFHYMRIHDLADKDSRIFCKKCSVSFDSGKHLLRHINYVHSKIEFTCEYCATRFGSKRQLREHIRIHSQTKPYACDLCDFRSKYSTGIRTHKLWKHTENRFICKTCTGVFASQSLLDRHKCKNAMGIICPVCGVHLKKRSGSSFNRHLKSHVDTYQYKCDKCPAKYKALCNYKIHMDKHAGTPRYQCEYCKRDFYAQSVLIKHKRTHTGEKPYVCTVCNRGFTGNNNLKVHMKVHGIVNLIKKKDAPNNVQSTT